MNPVSTNVVVIVSFAAHHMQHVCAITMMSIVLCHLQLTKQKLYVPFDGLYKLRVCAMPFTLSQQHANCAIMYSLCHAPESSLVLIVIQCGSMVLA
jgi:hypothetical protein